MASFSVYVEGATDPAAGAVDRLAKAMSARYGLPAADLAARINGGRFRVKANVDRETAEVYRADLAAIGAIVKIEEGVRPSSPSIPVQNVPAQNAAAPPTRPSFQSGLAAAFTPSAASEAPADLGALGDGGALSLQSLDGAEPSAPPPAAAFAPPSSSAADASFDAPMDAFAPPDMQEKEMKMELVADEEFHARKQSTSTPPLSHRHQQPIVIQEEKQPKGPNPIIAILGPRPRARLVTGVLLAIFLGFLPAHIIGRMREKAYAQIDYRIVERQKLASTATEIAELDDYRAKELAAKKSTRNNIALVSMVIWLVVGGGLGFAWFRLIPWDKKA